MAHCSGVSSTGGLLYLLGLCSPAHLCSFSLDRFLRFQLVSPAWQVVTVGLEQPGEGAACPLGVPVLNVMSSLAPAGLHSDPESTSTMQEDWRGGGLPQAVQGAPSPSIDGKVFPAPAVRDYLQRPSPPTPARCFPEGAGLSQQPCTASAGPGAPQSLGLV